MPIHVRIECPPEPLALEALAEGIVRLNVWYMEQARARGQDFPGLYEAGVRYRRETPGTEWWESVDDVLGVDANRSGDCEDLANYRAAWLRVYNAEPNARTRVIRTPRGTFHAIVQREDGTLEDPSRIAIILERRRTKGR